jgi:DNA replication licensing factor MCM2
LRKYIAHAKRTLRPKLYQADLDKISRVYAELRKESLTREGMPVAVRHIESIIRMSEAHAAMHLRENVNDDDVNCAVSVMIKSFISTQKHGVQKHLTKRFSRYTNYQRDFNHLLLDALRTLLRETLHYEGVMGVEPGEAPVRLRCAHLEEKAREFGIFDLSLFYDSDLFREANFTLLLTEGAITHPRA